MDAYEGFAAALFDDRFLPKRVLIEPQPDTSKAAYDALRLNEECEMALRFIKATKWRGCTGDELDQHTGRGHQRIADLRRKGLIVRNGEKRATRTGRLAYVYVAR